MNITLNYTDKSFVVNGTTKEYKDQLKALGGRYNPNLKTGPGYIFSNKKEQEVREFVDKINNNDNDNNNNNNNKDVLLINNNNNNNNNKDVLLINNDNNKTINTPKNRIIMPKTQIQTTSNSLEYPNRFIASDGLSYQIIIQTCPLPQLNQKVTVKYPDFSFDCIVSDIDDKSLPINDIYLTYQDNDVMKKTRAVIVNGKWQIHLLDTNHELEFHV